ncbi:tyrosine-type recombinase/integrase [Fictibacillus enclensis]|uniref:tyrosine-type recombinase/integrase n=1 Tax=Fictibacillus enclensis TaxID=1017270 RepID=UPI0024BF8FB0|nr:tyrosine-type recombinase/integrase [Fictibacillus enclensis]WHY73435.1 tyrosine-type recombinase/integrase [Fictibacillus enclensis]
MSRKGKSIVKRRSTSAESYRPGNDTTLEDAYKYFVTLKKTEGVRQRTMTDYETHFNYFRSWLTEFQPDVLNVSGISPAIIRSYSVYLSEEKYNDKTGGFGLSPYTVNIRIRFLKTFFNALFREEIVNVNPVNHVKLMRVDEDTYEPLTDEEIERLLAVPDSKEYAQFRDLCILYTILDCGARISEICDLEINDIDFKTRAIILPAHKNKNRKPRIMPLSNQVIRMLMELVQENKTHFDTNYVFLANCGTRYNPNSFRKRLTMYRDKARIKKRVSPHGLRHHFCQMFIRSGGDVFTLARIVGHQDLSTTRKYIQMSNESIQEQHAMFSPVLRIRKKYK